jgi:beta-glucanase (GH16 family)
MTLFSTPVILAIPLLLLSFVSKSQMGADRAWNLVWSDEFEGSGMPDESKWSYEVGDGCPQLCGFGNNEKQNYTQARRQNVRVEDGKLIIQAHKENWENSEFTSAKLVSKPSGSWKYGKIEVKAKLPKGRGVWPAIWMMPTNKAYGSWPKSGEIDIMEHVGYMKDSIYGTVHTEAFNHVQGTQKGGQIFKDKLSEQYHVYGIEWEENKIDFLVDDVPYFTFEKTADRSAEWPFYQEFYLILNVAVGGNWGGKHGIDLEIWPQKMEIEYVRIFQKQ